VWFALAVGELTMTDNRIQWVTNIPNKVLYSGERYTSLKATKQGFHASAKRK
jgi:hypothetical protein